MRHRLRKIVVSLTYLTHDGRNRISQKESVVLRPFNGERLITDLRSSLLNIFMTWMGRSRIV